MIRHPVYRFRFRFSGSGHLAACLAFAPPDGVLVEGWELTGDGPHRWLRVKVGCDPDQSSALPVPGGKLLLSIWREGRQQLALVGPSGMGAIRPAPGLRVVPAPPGVGLALGLMPGPLRTTEVVRIGTAPGRDGEVCWSPVTRTGTALHGLGYLLDGRVVFDSGKEPAAPPAMLDPTTGTVSRLPLPDSVAGAVTLGSAGNRLLLGLRERGGWALTVASPDGLRPLAGLDHIRGSVRPLALDPTGTEVLLRIRTGIRSRLVRHGQAGTAEIGAPLGTAVPVAVWTGNGLWLPYGTTTAPVGLWWLPPGRRRLRPARGTGPSAGRAARVETFPGPAGPIESLVYGNWRTSGRVVLALHGGPAERWLLGYHAELQGLAAAGLAVVAPNQRGSTGYGRRHLEAITGAWGGPDLEDILAIGAHVRRIRGDHRPPPALYGTSYGAFLGLLALASAPERWSACVAVAPFLSGARLYHDADEPVRAMIERLDGTAQVTDAIGPRDLLALAPRMRGPVLVLHGAGDPIIPVGHSRSLVDALMAVPAVALTYRELPGRGHEAVEPSLDNPQFAEIARVLGGANSTSDDVA